MIAACGYPCTDVPVPCFPLDVAAEFLGLSVIALKKLIAADEIVSHTASDRRAGRANLGPNPGRFITQAALDDFCARRAAKAKAP